MNAAETRAVRQTEQLDWARLAAWLRDRLPACDIPNSICPDRWRSRSFRVGTPTSPT